MKLNKYILVSILLLAIIAIGAANAASDTAVDDAAVAVTEDVQISTSDADGIAGDGGDAAIASDANDDSKLGASAGDEKLAAGSVAPTYNINVTPDVMSGSNYVAQYGQIITVSGDYGNATGNVSIRFGFSGNYFYHNDIPLVDGKFSQNLTDYDRVRNNFQIQVSYTGDEYYKSATWSKNIHVQMNNVTANGAFYGLNPYMDVNLFDATGNVTFTLNERKYTKKLENGKTIQEFTNYNLGKNTVTMYYEGDGVIKPIEKTFTFTVEANIDAPTIYNYQPAIVNLYFGEATGKVNVTFNDKTEVLDIKSGVATTELKGYAIGDNTFEVAYSGDDTFNPFETTKTFTVLDKENATIVSSVYQTANHNFIFINIPHATGNINVTVNGNKDEWTLENETVIHNINASDKITELIVSYEGNVRLNPTTSSFYVNLTDYVVNNKTFRNYFNMNDGGRLYDFIEDGITLDFQGKIINPVSANEMNIEISKPINVISSTGDAYIDLNTTAGSLLGEHPGSSFVVGHDGSGSNISGIYLHNTELWISNTTNVVFDNISVVVEDQRVGSGVGATSVRDNSSYVTLKNSYFYTRNNGGSTTFTFAWANHCIFDNNTVKAEGNVGNLLYLNVYNIKDAPTGVPLNTYNQFINNKVYGKEGSAISVGIMVEGEYNLIANNTCFKCSISTSFGGVGANNNTYYGNTMTDGSSLTAQAYSIVYGNNATGTLSTGANSVAYDNTVGKTMTVGAGAEAYDNTANGLTVSGAGAIAHDNSVTGTTTVSGANSQVYSNELNGTIKVTGAGATFSDNIVNGTTTISGKNAVVNSNEIEGPVSVASTGITVSENNIQGEVTFTSAASQCNVIENTINSSSDYAVDLGTSKNNVIQGNIVSAANVTGTDAIKNNNPSNVVEDSASLSVSVEDMQANQSETVVNVLINENATGIIRLYIDGQFYIVKYEKGMGSLVLSKKDFLAGEYSVVAIYDGDKTFAPARAIDSFNVCYYDALFNITFSDAKAGEDVVITAVLLCENNITKILNPINDLMLVVDGVEYSAPFESNTAVLTVPNVVEGIHTVVAIYPGENGINPESYVTTFTLEKVVPVIDVAIADLKLDEDATVTVTIANATGKVNIIVDGVENLVDLVDGVATTTIPKATAGTHTVVANYAGDAKNSAASGVASKTLTVLATEITDVNVAGDLNINAVLKDATGKGIEGATILYKIGSQNATVTTGANGVFTIKGEENAKVDIYFVGSDLLFPTSTSVSLSGVAPTRVASSINASQLTCYAVDTAAGEKGAMFKVTLSDASGKLTNASVQFALNGVIYNATTDENGVASVQVNINKASIYTCAVSYLGDVKHDASFTAAKIIVNKKKTALVAKAAAFKVKTKIKKYTVTLRTIKGSSANGKIYFKAGKRVTLTVGGKTYIGKTNSKGQAIFKITKLNKKGRFNAVIRFAGDNTYYGVTKKVRITVK